jgi:small redox-active disulfide protein 2
VKIEVFGTGCVNCARLEAKARTAAEQLGIKADFVKIDDFETFIRRGITATPGVAINGVIVSQGRVPTVDEIVEMLTDREPKTVLIDDTERKDGKSRDRCSN